MSDLHERARRLLDEFNRRARMDRLQNIAWKPAQRRFLDSRSRIAVFAGCNGSGKTYALVAKALSVALGREPWSGKILDGGPRRAMLGCPDFTHNAGEDLYQVLEQLMPAEEVVGTQRLANGRIHRWDLRGRGSLKVMSYEQTSKVFEGSKYAYVGFNEPPPFEIFMPCLRAVAKGGGTIGFAMTPLGADSAWVHARLIAGRDLEQDVEVISADMDAGDSYLTQEQQDFLKRNCDPAEYEARIHGRFAHLSGRVYKQFTRDRHVISSEDALVAVRQLVARPDIPKGCVVDPHDRKPWAIAWFLVDPAGKFLIFDESPEFWFHECLSHPSSTEAYAELIRQKEAAWSQWKARPEGPDPQCFWRIIDPNFGVAYRSAGAGSIVDGLQRSGLVFDFNVSDRIVDGHGAVKQLLNEDRLLVTQNCKNMIFGLENYVWAEPGSHDGVIVKEKVAEVGKDFADVARYMAMFGCRYFDPSDLPTPDLTIPRTYA